MRSHNININSIDEGSKLSHHLSRNGDPVFGLWHRVEVHCIAKVSAPGQVSASGQWVLIPQVPAWVSVVANEYL